MSIGDLTKRRAELEEALRKMIQQRDELTAQILRFEGAILLARELEQGEQVEEPEEKTWKPAD